MIHVPLADLTLPDWGWRYDDLEELAKLTASLHRFGPIYPLIVRRVDTTWEIIDGRRRLQVLQKLGVDRVWIHDMGALSKMEAIKVALTLELSGTTDFPRLAEQTVALKADPEWSSLAGFVPFTADRLGYFQELMSFNWDQFTDPDEQRSLFDDDDTPAPKAEALVAVPVPAAPVAAPAAPKRTAAAPPSAANDAAARLAARAAFTAAESGPQEPKRAAPPTYSSVIMGDMFGGPEVPSGWKPEAPPSLDGIDEIEFDTETTGLRWYEKDRPIGIAIYYGDKRQYLPWGHAGGNLGEEQVREWARRELRGKKIYGLNTRFDNHMTHAWGVDLEAQGNRLGDVAHYAALIDEYQREYSLEALSQKHLGIGKEQGLDKTRMASYHAGQVAEYAMRDVELVRGLRHKFWPMMDDQELHRVRELEEDVIYVVCEAERNAAHVDGALLQTWDTESADQLHGMLNTLALELGFMMNPDKAADWARLFQTLGLENKHVTEKGAQSFADHVLAEQSHPLVQMARKAGKLASMRSKFLTPYAQAVQGDHIRFNLHQLRGDEYGTVRGRFSCSEKNLQQVMSVDKNREAFGYHRDDASHDADIYIIRSGFTPANGLYLSADAQAIEYRLAAHFAGSEKLIKAYQDDVWVDFHEVVRGFVRPYKDISRKITKNLNFAKIYGAGKDTVARTIGLPRAESDAIVEVYDRTFPEFGALLDRAQHLAEARGFVRTVLGRRARFTTSDQKRFSRAALNYVIQGSAADIMKTKLVELHKERKHTGFLMRQTVHDEVDGDSLTPETPARVAEILNRQTFDLKVPIMWQVKIGPNWAAC